VVLWSTTVKLDNGLPTRRCVRKYIWCGDCLAQWSLMDFCIVSADLFRSVFYGSVERGTAQQGYPTVQDQAILPDHVEGKDTKKSLQTAYRNCYESPRMHRERGGGMAAVQASSAARVCVLKRFSAPNNVKYATLWWNQGCGAATQISGSDSSSRHLYFLAPAPDPTSRSFWLGYRTIWSTEH